MTILSPTTTSSATAGTDVHGNAMTGSPEAIAAYGLGLDRLLRFDVDLLVSLEELLSQHAEAPMAHVWCAYLCLSATDPNTLDDARAFASALEALPKNEREQAHAAVIERWLAGDWHAAARGLDDLLQRWPTDLLALFIGQQLDFFVGDARNLRDRIGRSLGALPADHPHHAYVLGMHAFGLEECGTYDAALDAGLAALDGHADDVWATHAIAHVHEMRGDVAQGTTFLRATEEHWGDGNLFTVHLWWHLALYELESGRHDQVFEIYDTRVHHATSQDVPLELVDASALLWRLRLDGVDVGNRFDAVADGWGDRAEGLRWYAFNDVHTTMALVGAGRLPEARRLVDHMARSLADGPGGRSNRAMTAEAGLPAARALLAHAEDRHADVVAELLPVRHWLITIGGSNAQRDVLERTLVDSAIASGQHDLAAALLRERLAQRDTSSFAWRRQVRLRSLQAEFGSASRLSLAATPG